MAQGGKGPSGVTAVIRAGCGAEEGRWVTRGRKALGPAWKWPPHAPGQPALPCERRREAFEGGGIKHQRTHRVGENKTTIKIDS